ncbi:MAG: hypothetical protein J1F69_01085 [Clostridiales bacterium]|nr:hypothetical protein [Clostridiales bacterium]
MRTAFTVFTIFCAVVLLVRFAAQPTVPRFSGIERVTQKSLLFSVRELGKKCVVTEHGLGISHRSIKLKKILDACKNRVTSGVADDWQYALNAASDTVLHAFSDGKKAARYSAYCGHVGKYPRVFLFCDLLTKNSGCELTREVLFEAISAFEISAKFTLPERKILCGMLKLCLIGYLCGEAQTAIARAAMYDKGVSDGKSGIVNLDYLNLDDYVCGIEQGCINDERNAVSRLFEYNGVDKDGADSRRRKLLSQMFVSVNSVLRSLSVIDSVSSEIFTPIKSGEHGKRYLTVFNILFPALLAVYAVFTCVFASPKYVALFFVAAVITYGIMRIPALLYAPTTNSKLFSQIENVVRRFTKRKSQPVDGNKRLFMTETAYFGCEPQYIESEIDGDNLKVICDNRGEIKVKYNSVCDCIYVGIKSDGIKTSLSECDGVIERHRATYRVCLDNLELCVETLIPIGTVCVVMRVTIINRSDVDRTVDLIAAVVRSSPKEQVCFTEDIKGGAMAVCDNGFAISLFGGKYGGDLSEFCENGILKHSAGVIPSLIAADTLQIKRFSKITKCVAVVYASRNQAENMFEYIADSMFYSRAVECAAEYCKLSKSKSFPNTDFAQYECRKASNHAPFLSPQIKKEYSYVLPFGGISPEGITVDDNLLQKPMCNRFIGGALCAMADQYGIQSISMDGKVITPNRTYTRMPCAFVAVGENDIIWSPSSKPLGCGNTQVVHARGYTQYTCAYNGILCEQTCFAAKDRKALFTDITLFNKTNCKRKLDVMFSVLFGGANVSAADDGVLAEIETSKLLISAIGEKAEYALYKEGYFVYGNINRVRGFRNGGVTPAPTASVGKTLEPNGSTRIVFCIADKEYMKQLPDISAVDALFDGVKSFYNRLGRLSPKTDNGILNISYIQSLYSAYCAFASRKVVPLYDECFILDAVKYVDSASVKQRIYAVLSEQKQDGCVGGDYSTCLQTVRCVIEYSEFVKDIGFLNEILPYLPCRVHGKLTTARDRVYNHIVRAAEYLATNHLPMGKNVVHNIWQYKNLIYVFRFLQNKLNINIDLHPAYKKCLTEATVNYSMEVKRLAANNFFEFASAGEAYMCAKLLFDLDFNEKAYNIIRYNNPIERGLHYGSRLQNNQFDYFTDSVAAAVYFVTVTEQLFGVKFRGKTLKLNPHTAVNTPKIAFDIYGKNKDTHILIDDTTHVGNLKMRINRINYPADSVDVRNLNDDIVFYRDGNE